jgi:hypothetical protein
MRLNDRQMHWWYRAREWAPTNFIRILSTTDAMNLVEFADIDAASRARKPKLFRMSTADPRASFEQLASVEHAIGRALPSSYREFVQAFGGGNYGLTTVFSCDPSSEWFLPKRNADHRAYLPKEVIAFSDDFAGGLYVFKCSASALSDAVYYWNSDGGLVATEFRDLFEFVAANAY